METCLQSIVVGIGGRDIFLRGQFTDKLVGRVDVLPDEPVEEPVVVLRRLAADDASHDEGFEDAEHLAKCLFVVWHAASQVEDVRDERRILQTEDDDVDPVGSGLLAHDAVTGVGIEGRLEPRGERLYGIEHVLLAPIVPDLDEVAIRLE